MAESLLPTSQRDSAKSCDKGIYRGGTGALDIVLAYLRRHRRFADAWQRTGESRSPRNADRRGDVEHCRLRVVAALRNMQANRSE